jgi:hypothetical protein
MPTHMVPDAGPGCSVRGLSHEASSIGARQPQREGEPSEPDAARMRASERDCGRSRFSTPRNLMRSQRARARSSPWSQR